MLQNVLSVLLVLIVICAVVSTTPGIFNMKIFRALNGTKCTGLSTLQAFAPFYNITFSRKLAYGSSPFFNAGFAVCLALLVFRVFSVIMVSRLPILIVFSSGTMYMCILLYMVMYIANAVDFCRMLNCGFMITMCCIIVAPVGYYMLSTQVLSYFEEVEDSLSGTFEA